MGLPSQAAKHHAPLSPSLRFGAVVVVQSLVELGIASFTGCAWAEALLQKVSIEGLHQANGLHTILHSPHGLCEHSLALCQPLKLRRDVLTWPCIAQ